MEVEEQVLDAGQDVFLDIDIQGANQVRVAAPEAVSIFISPPSWQEQERRLVSRGTDSDDTIQLRQEAIAAVDKYIAAKLVLSKLHIWETMQKAY